MAGRAVSGISRSCQGTSVDSPRCETSVSTRADPETAAGSVPGEAVRAERGSSKERVTSRGWIAVPTLVVTGSSVATCTATGCAPEGRSQV